MTETECPPFTETVKYEMDGEYKIAHGWTSSSGSSGCCPYIPPDGWKYDSRYSDIKGPMGSHGGCRQCYMTLVHLINIDPLINDPCEGIMCTLESCDFYDLWSQKCVDGKCVNDILIEQNSSSCGYASNPTIDISYTQITTQEGIAFTITTTWDYDGLIPHGISCFLYPAYKNLPDYPYWSPPQTGSKTCTWIPPSTNVGNTYTIKCILIHGDNELAATAEQNVTITTTDPCEGVICNDTCIVHDLWSQRCADGICINDSVIESNSPTCGYVPPDPCEGVICKPDCFNYDLYNTVCEYGTCTKGTLIELNSPACEYADEDTNIFDTIMDNKEIVAAVIAGVAIIKIIKK